MFQNIVNLYAECCGVDSNLSKRLLFWSHELNASTPHLKNKNEKISAVSEFVFSRLFLSPNANHLIVDWGQAMQERKCHPLMLAVLFGYFCEAAEVECLILNNPFYRYAKATDHGIVDLHSKGTTLSHQQIVSCLSDCSQKSFEPLSSTELKKLLFVEVLKSYFEKRNWEQVLTALKFREKEGLGSPKDFTTFAYALDQLGRKTEALQYIRRFSVFAPDQVPFPGDLTEMYPELHIDQIEAILSKPEFRPFES